MNKPLNKPSIFRTAYAAVRRPTLLLLLLVLGILAAGCFPTNLRSYPILPAGTETPTEVRLTEDYVRYVPTVLQIAIPNIYFHLTTAYAILRHNGVDVGKRDFLGPIHWADA